MSNLEANYKMIFKNLKEIIPDENFYFKPTLPKLIDLKTISLTPLTIFKSINSERQLFRDIKGWNISTKIKKSVYNKRKRKLFPFI